MLAHATWKLYPDPQALGSGATGNPWLTSACLFPGVALWSFSISAASPTLPDHLFLLLAWLRSVGAITLGPDHPTFFMLSAHSA